MENPRGRDRWIVRPRPIPDPTARLFCFPHAGAGVAMFNSWAELLPPGVELCSVRLPGRESRIDEPPHHDIESLMDTLLDVSQADLDVPSALFGHCSGAVLAFELARRLRESGHATLRYLFVASQDAPHVRSAMEPLHDLPLPELARELEHMGGTDPSILRNDELMKLMEPMLRADFEVFDNYEYRPGEPLSIPISVFGTRGDPRLNLERLGAWYQLTDQPMTLRILAGSHFIVGAAAKVLIDALTDDLRALFRDGSERLPERRGERGQEDQLAQAARVDAEEDAEAGDSRPEE